MLQTGTQELLSHHRDDESNKTPIESPSTPINQTNASKYRRFPPCGKQLQFETKVTKSKECKDSLPSQPRSNPSKTATQLKYAMTKTRIIQPDTLHNHSDNTVENLESNVPYIALLDPLDPDYVVSLNNAHFTGNSANEAYSRMSSNGKSFESIMTIGAAAYRKWSSSSSWWANESSST